MRNGTASREAIGHDMNSQIIEIFSTIDLECKHVLVHSTVNVDNCRTVVPSAARTSLGLQDRGVTGESMTSCVLVRSTSAAITLNIKQDPSMTYPEATGHASLDGGAHPRNFASDRCAERPQRSAEHSHIRFIARPKHQRVRK